MDLSRQEYPALLSYLQPGDAVHLLNDRVKQIEKVAGDVSDWLAERRRVEEAYAQGLRRLAASRPDSPYSLGVFKEPWQSILGSCETYADSHDTLSSKIEADVERPLRSFMGKGKDIAAITTMQGNLASLGKDVEEAQKKANKLAAKSKAADSAKLSSAQASLHDAQNAWESAAPYVFEQLQALDESRVDRLRDALTQLHTHQLDQLQRSRAVAESTLNSLLAIDTAEEISRFVAATTQGAPSLPPPGAAASRQSRRSTNLSTSSAAAAAAPPPHPPGTAASADSVPPVPDLPPTLPPLSSSLAPPAADDSRSERSATPSAEPRRSESRGGAGGVPPVPPIPKDSEKDKEKKKSGFGGLRRLGTVMSRRKTESKPAAAADSPEKKTKAKTTRNPLRRGSTSRNSMYQLNSPGASATDLAANRSSRDGPAPARERSPHVEPAQTNGAAAEQSASPDNNARSSSSNGTAVQEERKPRPPSTIQEESENLASPTAPSSSAIDDITRAQQEAAAVSDDHPQFKVDIKNEPIQEEGSDSAQALSNVANTLRLGAQAPSRRAGTVRGRRDVRNTVFVPSNASPESVIPPVANDTLTPLATSPATRPPDDTRGSDAQSIRSAHSLNSISHGAIKHAEMHEPGLNASIVETVSATFSASAVTQAMAVGEVVLVHNNPTSAAAATTGTETIRLENFSVLEKVAPNPAMVVPLPGRTGEYTADLAALSRPQVAFKYKVHLDEANLSLHAPVLLTPTWKIEPTQASVILSYAYNPAFASPAKSVALSNVVIAISLDGRAASCLSKPQGTFNKDKNTVFWRLDELPLSDTREGPPLRILARFATPNGEARPGNVEARWEIAGENAAGCGSGLGLTRGVVRSNAGGSDPFADGTLEDKTTEWKHVPVQRKIVSGKYVAS